MGWKADESGSGARCCRGSAPKKAAPTRAGPPCKLDVKNIQNCRSTIIFLISAIAFAGLSPFGQVWAQFMIVWQR